MHVDHRATMFLSIFMPRNCLPGCNDARSWRKVRTPNPGIEEAVIINDGIIKLTLLRNDLGKRGDHFDVIAGMIVG